MKSKPDIEGLARDDSRPPYGHDFLFEDKV
jgi:hypothetical protein